MTKAEEKALDLLTESVMKRAPNDREAYRDYFSQLGALAEIEKLLKRTEAVRQSTER